jgi:TonB family protein
VYPDSGRREFSSVFKGVLLAVLLVTGIVRGDDPASKSDSRGEKIYEPGGDVKSPKLVHYVEPEFSPSSKEAFVEGTVKLSTVVTREGVPTNLRVTSGLNAEEDRTAIEAVKQWKFQPGTKGGQPVNVRVTVEVTFHLL